MQLGVHISMKWYSNARSMGYGTVEWIERSKLWPYSSGKQPAENQSDGQFVLALHHINIWHNLCWNHNCSNMNIKISPFQDR